MYSRILLRSVWVVPSRHKRMFAWLFNENIFLKYELQADKTNLWAFSWRSSSPTKVTSWRYFSFLNIPKDLETLEWKSFHFKENCSDITIFIVTIYFWYGILMHLFLKGYLNWKLKDNSLSCLPFFSPFCHFWELSNNNSDQHDAKSLSRSDSIPYIWISLELDRNEITQFDNYVLYFTNTLKVGW